MSGKKTAVAVATVLGVAALLLSVTGSSTAAERIRQAERIRPGAAVVSDTDHASAASDHQILANGRIRGTTAAA